MAKVLALKSPECNGKSVSLSPRSVMAKVLTLKSPDCNGKSVSLKVPGV